MVILNPVFEYTPYTSKITGNYFTYQENYHQLKMKKCVCVCLLMANLG